MQNAEEKPLTPLRARLHTIIFESDTTAGKAFDVGLLVAIVLSIAAVMLESVPVVRTRHRELLTAVEWGFTVLFTVELLLRLACVQRPLRYLVSFYGLIDLLTVLPSYASLFVPGAQSLLVIRIFRLLRVFRVLKLGHFLGQGEVLLRALRSSREKIVVFLSAVLAINVTVGALMYLVEGEQAGFDSIPRAMYWAIVTMTTVGYGDLSPKSALGQFIASLLMVVGYGILAVPTGIVSVELARATRASEISTQACPSCGREGHDPDAVHCKYCGAEM